MRRNWMAVLLAAAASLGIWQCAASQVAQDSAWEIHDMNRPVPPAVETGPADRPAPPPSDAVILFDGSSLDQWTDVKGGPPRWRSEDGYVEVVPKTASMQTKQGFGDCQLHVEWAAPVIVKDKGQDRGNSGVFLMGRYEIQVLDGYDNRTYADGMVAAVYGQYPPLVNACRKPGEWQTYDIVFHAPRFGEKGTLTAPARVTVFHNGVLAQDDIRLTGPTEHKKRPPYQPHADRLPLMLQEHGNPVRYRNIWIRDVQAPH